MFDGAHEAPTPRVRRDAALAALGLERAVHEAGPYPTSAPGSDCEVEATNDQGEVVDRSTFYQGPPNRPIDRAGWVRGTGLPAELEATDVKAFCYQSTENGRETPADQDKAENRPGLVTVVIDTRDGCLAEGSTPRRFRFNANLAAGTEPEQSCP